jgi:hypothetical protein
MPTARASSRRTDLATSKHPSTFSRCKRLLCAPDHGPQPASGSHADPFGQSGGVHVPPMHVSLDASASDAHAVPSLHAVPSGATGYTHPLALHVPDR